jgi:hypothetical protein
MLYLFSRKCYQWVSVKITLVASLLFLGFLAFVLPEMAAKSKEVTGTGTSPDTLWLYSAQELYRIAAAFGEEGRAYYIQTRFSFDVIWPLVYFFFLGSAISLIFRTIRIHPNVRLVNVAPFFSLVFDYLENIFASVVMYRYPEKTPVMDHLTPVFTLLKWSGITVSFIALFLGVSLWLVQRLRNHL